MLDSLELIRCDLDILADQFSHAAQRFPCLTHVLLRWPEGNPEPTLNKVPRYMRPLFDTPACVEADGTISYTAIFPETLDTEGNRYFPGFCGHWWLRRDYGQFRGSTIVRRRNEQTACMQQLRVLMPRGAIALRGLGLSLPKNIIRSTSDTCWLLALQCFLREANTRPVDGFDVTVIDDVFIASAMLCKRLSSKLLVPANATSPTLKPLVQLRGVVQKPIVCGTEVDRITKAKYLVVQQLLDAGPDGLSTSEFQNGNAVQYLRSLRKSSKQWAEAIVMAGSSWGRYSIHHE